MGPKDGAIVSFVFQILDLEGHKHCPEAAQDASRASADSGILFQVFSSNYGFLSKEANMNMGWRVSAIGRLLLNIGEEAPVTCCKSSERRDWQGLDSTGPCQLGKPERIAQN